MLIRHHEDTKDLETRQQRAVHNLRSDQVAKQHETELVHQEDYTKRSQGELRKKHAMELRKQPKSLKVSIIVTIVISVYFNPCFLSNPIYRVLLFLLVITYIAILSP